MTWLTLSDLDPKGNEHLSAENGYKQEGLVPFVVDAVYAMAHALKALHSDKCQDDEKVCSAMLPLPGPDLLHRIRNTSFIGRLDMRNRHIIRIS